ncbi:MAG: hypothetical protein KDB03_27510, partial [Planctomycetales bacterium]|nr:hypothetical protein [Planctomycetales bacterium]
KRKSVSEGPNKNPSLTFRVGTFISAARLSRNVSGLAAKKQAGSLSLFPRSTLLLSDSKLV